MSQPNTDELKNAAAVALGLMTLGTQAIDRKFGEGYAAENPVLLGAFMHAAALHYHPGGNQASPQQAGVTPESGA